MSADLARAQDFLLDMNKSGFMFPRAEYNLTEHPERVGEGKTLFYPVGQWKLMETGLTETY